MKCRIASSVALPLMLCAGGVLTPAAGQSPSVDATAGFLEFSAQSGHPETEPGCPGIDQISQSAQFPARAMDEHLTAGRAKLQFHVTETGAPYIDKFEVSDARFKSAAFDAMRRVRCNRASTGRTFHWRIDFVLPGYDPLPEDVPMSATNFNAPLPPMIQQFLDQNTAK